MQNMNNKTNSTKCSIIIFNILIIVINATLLVQ